MSRHRTSLLPLLCLLACATQVQDPFEAAEHALREHDLVGALVAYDAVPVSHPRYPEAHAAAASIEGRIRRCHEMLLEALTLRSEWRDVDALAFLRLARAVWPSMPAVDGLIAATETRLRMFEPGSHAEQRPDPFAATAPSPVAEIQPGTTALPADSAAAGEPFVATEVSQPELAPAPGSDNRTSATPHGANATSTDAVARGLAQVESRLARSDLQGAVADLFELARRFPKDARVQVRLARLLHQRALLLYGQGAVNGAIADWEQLLEMYPSHPQAAEMLRAARAELNSEAAPAPTHRPLPVRARHGSRRTS
jgi:tetratricopeptide (TPR) repeat protein